MPRHDDGSDDFEPVDPEDSGIPPDDFGDDSYWYQASGLEITDDPEALDALYVGWYKQDADIDERAGAREYLMDYLEYFDELFDWDEWREWYDAA